jgi:hypothetical protein
MYGHESLLDVKMLREKKRVLPRCHGRGCEHGYKMRIYKPDNIAVSTETCSPSSLSIVGLGLFTAFDMVYSTPVFTAAAALSLLVPSVFAVPSPASKRDEVMYYPPLWKSDFVTLDVSSGPIPEVIPISIEEITASANGTEAVAESWFPDPETILAERSIIGGVDNRVLWNNQDYPYTASKSCPPITAYIGVELTYDSSGQNREI